MRTLRKSCIWSSQTTKVVNFESPIGHPWPLPPHPLLPSPFPLCPSLSSHPLHPPLDTLHSPLPSTLRSPPTLYPLPNILPTPLPSTSLSPPPLHTHFSPHSYPGSARTQSTASSPPNGAQERAHRFPPTRRPYRDPEDMARSLVRVRDAVVDAKR